MKHRLELKLLPCMKGTCKGSGTQTELRKVLTAPGWCRLDCMSRWANRTCLFLQTIVKDVQWAARP
eukprot:scaffold492003_cov20-Prasinocladus_malaysianus.AAC.1